MKERLQARIHALTELLEQAGKRLSAASITAINDAIAKLSALMGEGEPEEEAVEQAMQMLSQATISGRSTGDTAEAFAMRMSKAVRKSKDIPGGYKFPVFTWADAVVVASEQYDESEGYVITYYYATYAISGNTITFSNVQVATVDTIVRIAAQNADADGLQALKQTVTTGEGRIMERNGAAPLLLQIMSGSVSLMQEKTADGRSKLQGIATHGNVPNLNNPPLVYPTDLWQGQLGEMQDMITQGKALGCLGHPVGADGKAREASMQDYAVKFTSLNQDGDLFPFEAELLGTSAGKEVEALLQGGVALDLSTVAAGEVKKEEWQGEKAYVVQPDGFHWVRIADVVLQGASPGATITDVRLQALDSEPNTEDAMTREEILALIQEAQKSGGDQVAALQAQLAKMEESLGQTKTPALSDEDKALLAQAQEIVDANKAAKVAADRDVRVTECVTQMVTDKTIPEPLKQSAITIMQTMVTTADDVEGAKDKLLQAMKPMLDNQALLQSKGMYMPEPQEGDVKRLETPEEAINDVLQTRVENGTLPKDTGVQDPSNPYWRAERMLQTLVKEHPEYAYAYAQLQGKRVKSPEQMKSMLQQKFSILLQDIPTGAMTTSDIAAAIPYIMGIVTDLTPELIANRYCSVQPMQTSKGNIVTWKIQDQDSADIREVANFTGSYANDPGEKQTLKRIKGALSTSAVTPTAKKVGYDLSVEVMRRLRTDWGIDGSAVMTMECAKEIAMELNYNHLQTMLSGATGSTARTYGVLQPDDSSFDGEQWQKQIMNYLMLCRADIYKKTFAPTVAILGQAELIARIVWLAKEVGMMSDSVGAGQVARGVDIVGTLRTGEDLVSVGWWESLGVSNKLMLIARGSEWYRCGSVYAPYLGLYVTPEWVDPETLDIERGMIEESAFEVVDGNYLGYLTVDTAAAGTPV